jgi:hypothetical protein
MSSEELFGVRICCAIRRDLSNEFAICARLYAEAVVTLTSGVTSGSNFEKLRVAARRAQERAEIARVAFEEHVAGHGC